MKLPRIPEKAARVIGVLLLFASVAWAFSIHIPTLREGYLNAGDDHMHVAFSNELKRAWEGEGRLLGWNRLYGSGAPLFQIRPPGFYVATVVTHYLTGLTIEQALKFVVVFGFCLYPLTMFAGGRLLGLGFGTALCIGILSPLPISLWGHTIDAYQFLGVHKQLLANLVFPLAVGSMWRLLRDGSYGPLFAVSFAAMFMTHPYIAYSFAFLVPFMLVALASSGQDWLWQKTIPRTALWLMPAVLMTSLWLIPYASSGEIRAIDPFLSRHKEFDVTVCTTAETLRQFFLGGILDTTRFAGQFGVVEWASGGEWGWLKNGAWVRLPLLSALAACGLVFSLRKRESAQHGFLALAFLIASILFLGPDDFPFLDLIPFSTEFQNIHAAFIFDWAAIMLGGVALHRTVIYARSIERRKFRYAAYIALAAVLFNSYGERTYAAGKLADVRNINTVNGRLVPSPGMMKAWQDFKAVVDRLNDSVESGNISAFPHSHDDGVTYNELPNMVNRPMFLSGFHPIGGVYDILVRKYRSDIQTNHALQQLLNVRYVINSPFHKQGDTKWPDTLEPLYKDKFWELLRVKGDYGDLEAIPPGFLGFVGNEVEWDALMEAWVSAYAKGSSPWPWIVNFSRAGLSDDDIRSVKPFISVVITGRKAAPPALLADIATVPWSSLGDGFSALNEGKFQPVKKLGNAEDAFSFESVRRDRKADEFRISAGELTPVIFKRAFYRGWDAAIDGKAVPIYRMSPGFQMILVPKGDHIAQWFYTGPTNWKWAKAAFFAGIFFTCALSWRGFARSVHHPPNDAAKVETA
ncbi:MAG: hypothetical protein HZA20_11225 [Nitrospirae bacterium]|nr:hypothetical protein [Nitrospirota bacterium]